MKKSAFLSFLAIIFFGFLLTGCEQEDRIEPIVEQQNLTSARILTENDVQKDIIPVVQSFLNSQYDYLMGKDKQPQWDILSGSNQLQSEIDNYKKSLLQDYSTSITSYKSSIKWQEGEVIPGRIGSFMQSGNKITIYNFVENITVNYHYEKNGVIDNTESIGGTPYEEIVFKYINGIWKIESWVEKGNFGISSRWHVEPSKAQSEPIVKIDNNLSNKILATYNRTAAKNYAYTHVFSPSSNYPNYSLSPYNGDCTNFVSQCLQAGGWTQVNTGSNRWFHVTGTSSPPVGTHRSPSWTGANEFKTYIANSGRIVLASYPLSSMEVGDIIQLIYSSGIAYHTMIVTKKTGSNIYVSYRNGGGFDPKKDELLNWQPESLMKKWKITNSYGSLA